MSLDQFTSFILALLSAVVLAFILFCIYFYILVLLFPSIDATGNYVVMPIGQMLISILLAVITSGFLLVFFYKKIKKI